MDTEQTLPIVDYLAVEHANLVARFNEDFADSVLMVVRALGGRPEATSSVITKIDPQGIESIVTDPSGEHLTRV